MSKNIELGIFFTFIIGVILSVSVYYIVLNYEYTKTKNLFEFNADNRLTALKIQIDRNENVINSLSALFSSFENITRDEFHNFTKNILKNHENLQGLSWNPLIKNSQKKSYIEKARNDGFDNFKIKELDANEHIIEDTNKKEYVPVYYIEPYLKNKAALGLDISSHQGRYEAIKKARDTGMPVITQRINLVQNDGNTFGYLMMKALYKKGRNINTKENRRKYFNGVVVAVFNFDDFSKIAIRDLNYTGINLLLSDISAPIDKQFLYFWSADTSDNVIENTNYNLESTIHLKRTLNIHGREWSFLFTPTASFINNNKSWNPIMYLFTGLITTILFVLYMFNKAKDRTNLNSKNLQLIANEKELKEQYYYIIKQSKHAQMGEMLSMIAHQWRQPLAAIAATVISLKIDAELNKDETSHYYKELKNIEDTTQYLSKTINDFREFFNTDTEKSITTLEDIIDSSLSIVKPIFKIIGIKIILDYQCNDKFLTYPSELKQVVLNLLKNVQDIIESKKIENAKLEIKTYKKNNTLYLEIQDNAGGIPGDIIDMIFEPYFTTKSELNGTGLGLYMSKKIIEEHCNGSITAINKDNGACFVVEILKT